MNDNQGVGLIAKQEFVVTGRGTVKGVWVRTNKKKNGAESEVLREDIVGPHASQQ